MSKEYQYQKDYAQRMKAKGNKLVQVWIAEENVARLRKYAKRLRATR